METQNPHVISNRYSITPRFPLQTSPVLLYSRNFRVSAHSDRPARKNHLRRKLQVPTILTSTPMNTNLAASNPNTHTRDLWNQLESLAKADADSNEILRTTEPSTYKVKHNANLLAKPNSYSSGFITGKPGFVGVSVFCGFLLFIAFNKFFRKQEISSLEKEMLRRKIQARMAKESSIKGNVEVIQDSKEPVFNERPRLDKEEIRAMAGEIRSNREPGGEDFDVPLPEGDGLSIQDSSDVGDIVAQGKGSDSLDTKSGIITSLKEAREYLQNKEKKQQEPDLPNESWKDTDTCLGGNGDVSINNKDEPGELGRANREKWMEDNFHEFEPLVDKIRDGFRNNYMVAREKVNLVSELQLDDESGSELEWMKDERLREIVFQVRENELMGRDPFYLMDAQDKALFFKGLEKKVEKENQKLAHLHQYLHSNIENLDYGADGISLYDSPEKIIPRWKGAPPATTMSQEFLDDYLDQRKALFAESSNGKVESKNLTKTVIEGSDGSVKPGKKSGKEFWQHTKKWSRGFIDSYNAENDPEIKAVMKDIGKDLDRWITEKEIQDAADIMDKVSDKGKKFVAEKLNKLKREMELFGPQAVVSKYSEYGDEEEIDYYWWLDLPFLLCIEIYIDGDGDGDERIGFYTLEMASDLELDPKPCHIIAFEDAGDCKNLCYVIQTHMEMLGNGNAFVVPQLPKDTYQEAKANGFNVTVIRKGELKLDVDQTLEQVEEKIVEIGSKMYHDKIMKSHNVNVDSLMKGVFGLKKTRRLKRPTK